jgi:intracellular sulfur oxidation DsrE/DsrF family protein
MEKRDREVIGRRALITNAGVAAVAGLAAGPASVYSQASPQQVAFKPERHALDSWLDELPGTHRVFVDTATREGGTNSLRFASNILSAHEEDYGGRAQDIAIVVCFRHQSTPFGFDDALWSKYPLGGDDPRPQSNPLRRSITSMVEKGMHFAICSRATRGIAGRLATAAGVSVDEMMKELMAGAIPNSHFVPAGVMAVTRAQEYGYSLLYSE